MAAADIIFRIIDVFTAVWWIAVPACLFFIWQEFWVAGKKKLFIQNIKWVLLEIRIPKDVLKTPKAMENVMSAMHALYRSDPNWEDEYVQGKVLSWFSFEIAGFGGGVHFFARVPAANRNLLETTIYSEYPDAEIVQADDYVQIVPEVLPNSTYDIFGADYVLAKESPYPIRTYEFFEANEEEQRLDPVAALTEVMSRLREGEFIWLQYLIRPVGDSWKKDGEAIRDKMMGRGGKEAPSEGFLGHAIKLILGIAQAPFKPPTWTKPEKKEEKKAATLSPGEKEVLEKVEQKIAKLGFEAAIRFIYIDRKDGFTTANVSAISGAFKQFASQNLNSFKTNSETATEVTTKKFTTKGWFRESKLYSLKRAMYDAARSRSFPSKFSVLNTEELATVFHFPISSVGAPLLKRVGTRRGEPPAGLPIP